MDKCLTILAKVLFFPLYLFIVLLTEISGQGVWYRRQKRRMVSERPPLSDHEFLLNARVPDVEVPLWLAVRRAMAESCGLPAVAIFPRDSLRDLWRMQFPLPDLLAFVFRLERELALMIPRNALEPALTTETRMGRMNEFCDFAALVAGVLRGLQLVNKIEPTLPGSEVPTNTTKDFPS